ncbi:MAG: hypothetical protein ACRDRA_12955 [Pseudonocardiaceae bacterium]
MTDSLEPSAHPSPGDDRVEPAVLAADKLAVPSAAVGPRRRSAGGAFGALISSGAVVPFPSAMLASKLAPSGVPALQRAVENMSRSVTAAISAAVPQHFGALAAVRASTELNLVRKAAADVVRISAVPDRLTRILPTWVGSTRALEGLDKLSGVMPQLAGLDKLFRVVPQFTALSSMLSPQVEQLLGSIRSIARDFSRRTYLAVVAARDAVLRGDWKAVARFVEYWLDVPRSQWRTRVEAASDALLAIDPAEFGPDDVFGLLEHLEGEIRHRFAGRRLLCTTQLNYRRVVSLDELPVFVGEHTVPGMLPVAPAAECRALAALNEFDDHRLVMLLDGLALQEARIVHARGFLTSWAAAALACGSPPGEGERVRAKVLRRAQRINKLTSGSQLTLGR